MIKLTRRQLLTGALGFSAVGLLAYRSDTTFNLAVEEVPIFDERLPLKFRGYRVGFLSDIHLSRWFAPEHVESTVRTINESSLDLIVLGGDYLWVHDPALEVFFPTPQFAKIDQFQQAERGEFLLSVVSDLLAPLKAKDGVFALLGNHDHWYLPPSNWSKFNRNGITCLVNDHVTIRRDNHSIKLFGLDDYWTGTPKIPSIGPILRDEFRIVATHNPDLFRTALQLPKFPFHLGLAGHTHGGQVRFPGGGALFYNIEDTRFNVGLAKVGETAVYTTRGIGMVEIPVRANCPPELTVLTLQC